MIILGNFGSWLYFSILFIYFDIKIKLFYMFNNLNFFVIFKKFKFVVMLFKVLFSEICVYLWFFINDWYIWNINYFCIFY